MINSLSHKRVCTLESIKDDSWTARTLWGPVLSSEDASDSSIECNSTCAPKSHVLSLYTCESARDSTAQARKEEEEDKDEDEERTTHWADSKDSTKSYLS